MGTEKLLHVTVVLGAGPRSVRSVELQVPRGLSAAQVVSQSGLLSLMTDSGIDALQLAVWGRKVTPHHVVRDRDRIELCRPLTVDPKIARRERFQRQGAKSAGLFNKLRAGAKAGY